MTNFANSQITGIGITSLGGVKKIDEFVFYDLNGGKIQLPFADINYQTKIVKVKVKDGFKDQKVLMIPIAALKDKDGNLTMDKLSAYINGAVDVARDPVIVEMGMHTELAGVYTLMERMGLTGKTTALFLYQPIVRDFLKEVINRKSYFPNQAGGSYKDLVEGFFNSNPKYKTKTGFKFNPDFKLSDDKLINLIKKRRKS